MSKKEELDKRLLDLERDFGLKRASSQKKIEVIKTGIHALDYIIDGIKLCEGGHKLEFYGNESSGKTTFLLKVVERFQQLGKTCVWVTAESFHGEWAKTLGVDTDKLLLAYPESLEEAGELFVRLIPKVDLIAVDSIAVLMPEDEIERDINEPTRGLQAKVNSLICRKIYKAYSGGHTTTLIFINQIREKLGIMYGNPETTPGGRALKFMYDTRILFKAGKPIEIGTKEQKERIGTEINLFGKKNKLGKPQRKSVVDFYFNGHVDNGKSLLFAGLKYGIIELSGKTYTYGNKKAVGKQKFIDTMLEADWKAIEQEVWKQLK